jgi:cation diffusion facilitator CzcD-associated flavoprotein CzcO
MTDNIDSHSGVARLDVAVIGTGFGGLYALHKFRNELGLDVQAFDDAGDVGGTWYWNRYPGCRVDTEASVYCYSFDKELLQTWKWSERYPRQPEVLAYLNFVATKHDLRRSVNFNTRIVKAEWNGDASVWRLTTGDGRRYDARFVIEAVGLLSSTNFPKFPGSEAFKGEIYHASRWPHRDVELTGKRVAVIGTGSTGLQVITAIAPEVGHLYVLQRTPQYVVPLGADHAIPESVLRAIQDDPDEFIRWNLNTGAVFGFQESTTSALSVSAEERERVYQRAWDRGNGFAFMLETFSDITVSKDANATATDFVREKIRRIVKDPKTAELLSPKDFYAKRPLATDNYFETYNRANVTLVDVKTNPIQEITERGIRTTAGEIELDVIIFATGFDAVTGNYLKIETIGRDGLRLQDKWKNGPSAFAGVAIAGFPNLFMIYGPFCPFTSQPLVHEWQVNWFADLITHARAVGQKSVEVDPAVEQAWVKTCVAGAEATLFAQTDSWINGTNIPGKPRASMFYMGGMANYMKEMGQISGAVYKEFGIGA